MDRFCLECDQPITKGLVCGTCQEKLDGAVCISCNASECSCKCNEEES